MNINSQLDANQVMQLLGVSKFDQIKKRTTTNNKKCNATNYTYK